MYKKLVPFNSRTHAKKRLKPVNSFNFAKNNHIASLMINELSRASSIYPVVFLKEGEKYGLFALLGLKPGENLFVGDKGQWEAGYIPAIIRRYPFMLGKTENSENFMVGLDEESGFLSETEGQPLVDKDGKPSQVVENIKQYLSEIHRFSEITNRFCQDLADRNLLAPLNLQIKSANSGPSLNIAGCHGVHEKKFNELPDTDFLELRKKGLLPLIYSHLLSLAQLDRLIRLRGGIE
ncbi:MAG: SapC family protein [Desulfococcaceae bacterium]